MTTPATKVQPASRPPRTARNPAFDRLRGIGAVMVVFIHAPPFLHSNVEPLRAAGWVLRESCQLAVPFFFLLSGWMMGRKWLEGRRDWNELARSLGRLASLYVPWFLAFLAVDAAKGNPHTFEIVARRFVGFSVVGPDTTGYHLWFLPSLALALSASWISLRWTRSVLPVLAIGSALFASMYIREILGLDAPFRMVATEGLNLSLAAVALGVHLGARKRSPAPPSWMVVAATVLLFVEGALLQRFAPGKEPVHTFQFLRIAAAAGILLWANRSPTGWGSGRAGGLLDLLGRHSTAIYVSHLGFLVLIPFDQWVRNGFLRDNVVRWPVAIAGAILLSILLRRSPWPALRKLVA